MGTLNNSGQTLNGSGSSGQLTLFGGAISGGVVTSAGVAFTNSGGVLSGVTYDGPLNLTSTITSQSVQLANGTTVVGSSGSGPGTINVTGESDSLIFDNTQTISNDTINLGNSSVLYENDATGAGNQVLTLASSVTVNVAGNANIEDYSGYAGDGIVNDGRIDVTGYLDINPNVFTNSGTINLANDATTAIDPATFTDLSANTLTGGTYEAQAGSTLLFDGDETITTDDADVILSGAGSTIETHDQTTGVYDTIDTTLTTIGSSGELQFLAGRDWTTPGAAITNNGIIQLGGGTLTATASGASLTDAAGSELNGFGIVTATTFVNSGTIEAAGGTLEVTGAVTGTGTDTISRAATLEFGAGVSTAATRGDQDIGFAGGGTLHLLKPTSFYGEISDFVAGDTVELNGSWAFSTISHAHGVTTLTLASGSTKHGFEFIGDYAQSNFSITSGTTTKITYA